MFIRRKKMLKKFMLAVSLIVLLAGCAEKELVIDHWEFEILPNSGGSCGDSGMVKVPKFKLK